MNMDDAIRLASIQQRLIAATFREIKKEGHHKSSEGSMSLSMHMPNAFNQSERVKWSVEAYSYLLNPNGRLDTWFGNTAAEAISKAEDAIGKWVLVSEMEELEGHMSPMVEDNGDYQ